MSTGTHPAGAVRTAQRCIRAALVASLVTSLVTFALTASVTFGAALDANEVPFSPLMWLYVAICGALAFGIYRRSRTAAVLMLAYFITSKALWVWNDLELRDETDWVDFQDSVDACLGGGLLMGAVLIGVYALGVYGTVAYHRLQRSAAADPGKHQHQK